MPRNRNKTKSTTKTYVGSGDYDVLVKGIKDPISRLEKKVDHIEKSINKKATVNNAASTIGRTLGNFAGQGDLGAMAGNALAKYFGHGDYVIKSNSLMGTGKTTVPKFDNSGKRGTRIQEREFLGDVFSGDTLVSGSTSFDTRSFIINPTNPSCFPWLSKFAPLFDQWEPNGIIFNFVSTSSEFNGTSQSLGAVVMATDYDPYDLPYATKSEMENSDYSCSSKPSLGLVHAIECDDKERPTELLFTSTSNGAPLTSTNLGQFQIATKGCSTAGTTLGELWVSYDITFYKKQITNDVTGPFAYLTGSFPATANLSFMNLPVFGTSRDVTLSVQVGVGTTVHIANTQIGEFYGIIYLLDNIAGTDAIIASVDAGTDCVRTFNKSAGTVVGLRLIISTYFQITGPNPTMTMGIKTSVGVTTWEMDIYKANA